MSARYNLILNNQPKLTGIEPTATAASVVSMVSAPYQKNETWPTAQIGWQPLVPAGQIAEAATIHAAVAIPTARPRVYQNDGNTSKITNCRSRHAYIRLFFW